MSNNIVNKISNTSNKQRILMNNFIPNKISEQNMNLLWENINSSDESILKTINNIFMNQYTLKLNLINYLLNSLGSLPIRTYTDLIKFFKTLNPLNVQYLMGSNEWNYKIAESKIFFQNSISKKDSSDIFYNFYINLVKKKLIESKIEYNYFEFKLKRFNKTKDIVWVFDLDQFLKKFI